MASESEQAKMHRTRQSLKALSWWRLDDEGKPFRNGLDILHGELVTNRHERRHVEREAKRYGCNPHKTEHNKKCPKWTESKDENTEKQEGQSDVSSNKECQVVPAVLQS